MTTNNSLVLTPVGRLVQGDLFKEKTTDMKGAPLRDKKGNPRVEYFIAIAIPKTDPGFNNLWATIYAAGQRSFPNGEYNNPTFAWKYTDGDLPENKDKEGFPGCHVLKCAGGFAPRVYTKGGEARITDPTQIKRGDYIRVYIDIRSNDDHTRPGLFLNPSMVELIGYGTEISGGPDAAAVFGNAPVAELPPGASLTPTAGTPIAAGGLPQNNLPPQQQQAVPQNNLPPQQQAVPQNNLPPQRVANGVPSNPVPVNAGPQYKMTAKAENFTREQMHSVGWTDEQLIAQGYMVANDVQPNSNFLYGPPVQ